MEILLYTTHCPKCNALEGKLKKKEINFTIIDNFNVQEMVDKGFTSAPILSVDNKLMNFNDAINWINNN